MADVIGGTPHERESVRKYMDWVPPCKGGTFRAYVTPVLGVKVNVVLCSKCKLPHSAHRPQKTVKR